MIRFSPQIIPFMLTFAAMFYAAQGAFVSIVHLWYGDSYRKVEFVMDEWRDNEGFPYVSGRLAGSDAPPPFYLAGKIVDGTKVLEDAPGIRFESGRAVSVWFSPDAPLTSYNGESVNAVAFEGEPRRSGWLRLFTSLGLTVAAAVVGFGVTVWVAKRWARRVVVA